MPERIFNLQHTNLRSIQPGDVNDVAPGTRPQQHPGEGLNCNVVWVDLLHGVAHEYLALRPIVVGLAQSVTSPVHPVDQLFNRVIVDGPHIAHVVDGQDERRTDILLLHQATHY